MGRMTVLEDELVLLRPLTLDDSEALLAGEDSEVVRWFEWPRASTIDDVAAAISRWEESWRTGGLVRQFGIFRDRVLAGTVELQALGEDRVNVSYVVFPQYRRGGLARRSVALVLNYAVSVLGARVAVFKMLVGNEPSRAVAVGTGAVHVGQEISEFGGALLVYELRL